MTYGLATIHASQSYRQRRDRHTTDRRLVRIGPYIVIMPKAQLNQQLDRTVPIFFAMVFIKKTETFILASGYGYVATCRDIKNFLFIRLNLAFIVTDFRTVDLTKFSIYSV